MKRSEISNKDELKRAFKQIKDEEFKDVPDEDEIPFEISDSFRDKVMTGSSKRMSAWGRVINSTAKKAAAVAAVSVITLGVLMSVKAIREPVVEFISMTYEKTAALFRAEEETTTVIPPDTSETDNTQDPDHVTASSLSENEDAKPGDDKTKPEEKDGKKDDKSKDNGKKAVANGGASNNNDNEASGTAEPAPDDEVVETVEATCEQDGYTLMRRAGTDETYKTNIVPALGHDYELLKKVYSTCTVTGHAYYRCTRCDGTYDEELPLGAHNWVMNERVEKCGQPEEFHFICGICRKTRVEYGETRGHILDYIKDVPPGSCTQDGYTVFKCRDCGEIVNKMTDPTRQKAKHTKVTNVINPTCTEQGYTETKCSRCNEVFSVTNYTQPLGHNFRGQYSDGENGYKRCTRCGELVKTCNANSDDGHVYESETRKPTCTEDGFTQEFCIYCGKVKEKYDIVPAKGHDIQYAGIEDPTCTEEGYTLYRCVRRGCSYKYKTDIVPALGHDMKEMVIAPTCKNNGYTVIACSRCYERSGPEYNIIPSSPTAHIFTETSRTAPTCGKAGKVQYKCTFCGATKTETIDPTGLHDFKKMIYTPTCTTEGYTLYTCKVCGSTEKRDFVPALGHDFQAWQVVEPTATEQGYTIYKCTRCKAKENRDFVPALGSISAVIDPFHKLSLGQITAFPKPLS